MSKELPRKRDSEEVDLVHVFNLIGNAFERLFKFIANVFKWAGTLIINFLLFVKANFFKITIPVIVATILGYALDTFESKNYVSSMVVKPNFNSNVQLYDNISYLNALTQENDSIMLSKALNITPTEAGQLLGISIRSLTNDNSRIKYYNDFIIGLDSTRIDIETIDYEQFNENVPDMFFSEHIIEITSKTQIFPRAIQDAIVASVDENDYFDLTKKTIAENIEVSSTMLQKQLKEVDELRNIYNQVLVAESKKTTDLPSGGTSISFADKQQETKELNLFAEARLINAEITRLQTRKADLEKTITVWSNLKPMGEIKYSLYQTNMFRFFVGSILLTFFIVLLIETNKFLDKQKKVFS